jgi:hypothetical protein
MQDKIINLLKNNETESLCGEYFLIKRKDYEKLANEIQLIFALTDVVVPKGTCCLKPKKIGKVNDMFESWDECKNCGKEVL